MTASLQVSDRDIRQRSLVPPQRLAQCPALVVGVGAIGRQVALQLSAIGVARMILIDPDTVGVENLAAQGYWPADIGLPKVRATGQLCTRINPQIRVEERDKSFKRSWVREISSELECAAFLCVDSITTRRWIWESIRRRAAFFADGRMNGEFIRVLASGMPATDSKYGQTLFAAEEAFVGTCTSRSTIYTASIAAGMMVNQFTRWLRGLTVDADVTLNLLAGEMVS